MIGTCDSCEEDHRKLKYLYQDGVPILATCRYGCESRRSIPSAKNRNRPFSIVSIEKLSGGFEDSQWRIKVKDERGRIKSHHLKRYGNETEVTLRNAISKRCINAKQIHQLNTQIHYD
ncbi:hypothetical protein [Paenibacillus polymyxa]|uniref:hypothetical protein n=1 Tax=Paenibacillus polymyxa TaxID=1406 RepID=UPI00058A3369|nr:hypothetical protein [Paenibacillus polymyxa]AJE54249.1 hypothetical protein RE92_24990 [Paenibacillus polymyxa]